MCAVAATICAWLLLRAWFKGRYRLLLWSGLCFVGLTINNLLLVADKLILPDVDLTIIRGVEALLSMAVLLYGLVWELE
jgi:hypothetical protein